MSNSARVVYPVAPLTVAQFLKPMPVEPIVFIRVCFTERALAYLKKAYGKDSNCALLMYSPLATGAEFEDLLRWPRLERPETAYGMCCAVKQKDFKRIHWGWRYAVHTLQNSLPDEPVPRVVQIARTDRVAYAYKRAIQTCEFQNWMLAFESLFDFIVECARRRREELDEVALLQNDAALLDQYRKRIAEENEKKARRIAGIEKSKATRAANKKRRLEEIEAPPAAPAVRN
jgi:hypothetical protein